MRITKNDVGYQKRSLAREMGIRLELEQSTIGKKSFFKLYQFDEETGEVIRWLIAEDYTTREMYLALKASREIFKTATKLLQSSPRKET